MKSLIPRIMGYMPAGTSVKVARHFSQFILKGNNEKFYRFVVIQLENCHLENNFIVIVRFFFFFLQTLLVSTTMGLLRT